MSSEYPSSSGRRASDATTRPDTLVHVEVKGTLDVPLHLNMLAGLEDALVEQEIIKEAVRMAVSERLGCFDGVEVRLSSSGGREYRVEQEEHQRDTSHEGEAPPTRGHGDRCCEAYIHLEQLGTCVEAIQKAYEHILTHARLLEEVLSSEGVPNALPGAGREAGRTVPPSATTSGAAAPTKKEVAASESSSAPTVEAPKDLVERLTAARHLVAAMLTDRRSDIVEEAASMSKKQAQQDASHAMPCLGEREKDEEEGQYDMVDAAELRARRRARGAATATEELGVSEEGNGGFDENLRRNLLASIDSASEASEDEDTLRERYLKEGYTPL